MHLRQLRRYVVLRRDPLHHEILEYDVTNDMFHPYAEVRLKTDADRIATLLNAEYEDTSKIDVTRVMTPELLRTFLAEHWGIHSPHVACLDRLVLGDKAESRA